MQLNIYVPKERAGVLKALDEAVRRTGRQKNELVLEALESHLGKPVPEFKPHRLGLIGTLRREEIYDDDEWR